MQQISHNRRCNAWGGHTCNCGLDLTGADAEQAKSERDDLRACLLLITHARDRNGRQLHELLPDEDAFRVLQTLDQTK